MSIIGTALLSVYDKSGLTQFASGLADRGVELVSTGGTAACLRNAGLAVRDVEDLTGQAEMLDGRVKTLHPAVFGGILARRESGEQMQELQHNGVRPIDLVVVNLYPFEATIADPEHLLSEALEQIDIGGVSLLRAAYKNFAGVVALVDPADYSSFLDALDSDEVDLQRRLGWARKAVRHTAAYEAAIGNYLTRIDVATAALDGHPDLTAHPARLTLGFEHAQELRYGENPHQPAAFYAAAEPERAGLAGGKQLQGKELSFNNLLDTDAAWQLAAVLATPGAAVIKHANPCGAAVGNTGAEAYRRARATDPMSAFGGIVALNVPVDADTAAEIASTFIEVVVAPGFCDAARETLGAKANLRLIELAPPDASVAALPDYRFVTGGLLVQRGDHGAVEAWEIVSERPPTEAEEGDLRFAWSIVPFVHSNAVVLGHETQLIGVGAGQMSRVDACRLATWKAADAGHSLTGSAAASDAFFPFPDGIEVLAEAGITAVVQPGGSKRDSQVIAAADRLGLALVHTGARHFRH